MYVLDENNAKIIKEKLDIVYLIRMLINYKRITEMLFSPEQQILFNMIYKPLFLILFIVVNISGFIFFIFIKFCFLSSFRFCFEASSYLENKDFLSFSFDSDILKIY